MESWPVFIGLFGAPKYDIIWTENKNLIDRFLPGILTVFEVFPTRAWYVLDTLWTLFERQYLWKEAINKNFRFQ